MGVPSKEHHQVFSHQSRDHHPTSCVTRNLVTRVIYIFLPFLLLHLYFFSHPHQPPSPFTYPPQHFHPQQHQQEDQQPQQHLPDGEQQRRTRNITSSSSPPPPPPPPLQVPECDYFDGLWVRDDTTGNLYNDTTCGTIKEGQNCMAHGRPDTDYLRWRWRPKGCDLPTFDAEAFLRMIQNKHLAFIGDSLARNQLESLLCLLSTASKPQLLYRNGEDNKFRKWRFPPPYNASLSVYWSPFLVKGIEKEEAKGLNHNTLFLDLVDERWAKEIDGMDFIVFAIGHWFLHPAVYLDHNGSHSIGCHYCPGMNHTEVEFYDVFRMAFDTALNAVIDNGSRRRRGNEEKKKRHVTVTTFSPSHFVGEWDKAGACPKEEPYKEGEKVVEGMDAEMRMRQVEAVRTASQKASASVKIEALDVTKLALLRPDGHPGPYMHPFPFAKGVPERVQNDCVHWCLPGPIDTWNEIFLQMIKRWWEDQQDD